MTEPFAYDTFSYTGRAYEPTHPGRLATIASLYGMQPAPLSSCRVLELGCGVGANIIPVAYQWPESRVVGIDLSASSIEHGAREIAALGLHNVSLRHADITQIGPDLGEFDYIIAHGVYSWVPAPVREKMLSIFRANLAPQGIAYVSYNSQPDAHLRRIARDIMRFHVRGIADPREKIAQARAVLALLADASPTDTIYGVVLREQRARVDALPDYVLFHDDLSEISEPFLLHEVVEAAERHGLQYLADSDSFRPDPTRLPEPVRRLIERLPEEQAVAREQYLDLFERSGFRRTLLCRREVALERRLAPACVQHYHLAAVATPVDEGLDPAAPGVAAFKVGEAKLATDHVLSKAALLCLGESWPQPLPFAAVVQGALDRLGAAAEPVRARLDDEVAALTQVLFRAACSGHVALHLFPPRLTTKIGARPEASLIARRQAATGTVLTNLLHSPVHTEDDTVRKFIGLVDGTRTVDDLVAELAAVLGAGARTAAAVGAGVVAAPPAPEVTRAAVERNLGMLARLGLLIG